MLDNHAKIIQFFSVAKEVTGRKKLQKMIYILQKCNIPFEEKYNFHFYGPYSEELTLRIEELCNLGFLHEVKEEKSNYYQYNYTLTSDGEEFLNQFHLDMPDYTEKVNLLREKSSRFLELVSTMLYFDHLPLEDIIEKVHTVKPKQKYTKEEMEEAVRFINEVKQ
ncbi:YwgA family protein [Oceanobacillus piezotolerans]|uniref:YwgA family protein n=1 Tax=Oceanobacillus piezotolerans TaxID=2448030 RepID=A0A498D3S9_9BACI|nr:YwgA family protein [Oceanobacillus piezotolerans]RLL42852.1 YwgA family protein [Oceanobacillus piezotolerans]